MWLNRKPDLGWDMYGENRSQTSLWCKSKKKKKQITMVQVTTFNDVFVSWVSECYHYAPLLLEIKGNMVLLLYFSHYDLPNFQGIWIQENNAIVGGVVDPLFVWAPASVCMCCDLEAVPQQDYGGAHGLRHPLEIHQWAEWPYRPWFNS